MAADKTRFIHDHLLPNPRRVLGPQTASLIHCAKHEQFYPAAESCPWCLSWAEEQAAKRHVAPFAHKTPGHKAFHAKHGTGAVWAALGALEQDQWEQIAAMQNDMAPVEEVPEMSYDDWADMMAMKVYACPWLPAKVRGLNARDVVAECRRNIPAAAKLLGLFDRDPPAAP